MYSDELIVLIYNGKTTPLIFKRISMANLKKLEINFKGWYCPVADYIFMIHAQSGIISSGICNNTRWTTEKDPWWNKTKLQNPKKQQQHICTFQDNSCYCASDINIAKGYNKKAFNYLLTNKPSVAECHKLPTAKKKDRIIALSIPGNNQFETHFHIGRRCNFNCSYCSPGVIHDNYSPDITMKHFKHGLNLIEPFVHKNKSGKGHRLVLTGGEPFLNTSLHKLIKYAKENLKYQDVIVNTNGTGSIRRMVNLLDEYNVTLHISLHPEFTKDILIKKITKLPEKYKDRITIKVMGTNRTKLSKQVKSIMPDWFNISYYPIYGQQLSAKPFDNIKVQTYAEMKEYGNKKI